MDKNAGIDYGVAFSNDVFDPRDLAQAEQIMLRQVAEELDRDYRRRRAGEFIYNSITRQGLDFVNYPDRIRRALIKVGVDFVVVHGESVPVSEATSSDLAIFGTILSEEHERASGLIY